MRICGAVLSARSLNLRRPNELVTRQSRFSARRPLVGRTSRFARLPPHPAGFAGHLLPQGEKATAPNFSKSIFPRFGENQWLIARKIWKRNRRAAHPGGLPPPPWPLLRPPPPHRRRGARRPRRASARCARAHPPPRPSLRLAPSPRPGRRRR